MHDWLKRLLVPTLLLSACVDEVELPPIREQSEWLVLRGPTELPICDATFSTMEAEVMQISEMFGSGPVTVDYSWMPKPSISPRSFRVTLGGRAQPTATFLHPR